MKTSINFKAVKQVPKLITSEEKLLIILEKS